MADIKTDKTNFREGPLHRSEKKIVPNSWSATTGRKMGMTAADQWRRLRYKLYRNHFEFSSLIRRVRKIIQTILRITSQTTNQFAGGCINQSTS
jgi:hypothetical protein